MYHPPEKTRVLVSSLSEFNTTARLPSEEIELMYVLNALHQHAFSSVDEKTRHKSSNVLLTLAAPMIDRLESNISSDLVWTLNGMVWLCAAELAHGIACGTGESEQEEITEYVKRAQLLAAPSVFLCSLHELNDLVQVLMQKWDRLTYSKTLELYVDVLKKRAQQFTNQTFHYSNLEKMLYCDKTERLSAGFFRYMCRVFTFCENTFVFIKKYPPRKSSLKKNSNLDYFFEHCLQHTTIKSVREKIADAFVSEKTRIGEYEFLDGEAPGEYKKPKSIVQKKRPWTHTHWSKIVYSNNLQELVDTLYTRAELILYCLHLELKLQYDRSFFDFYVVQEKHIHTIPQTRPVLVYVFGNLHLFYKQTLHQHTSDMDSIVDFFSLFRDGIKIFDLWDFGQYMQTIRKKIQTPNVSKETYMVVD